MITVKLDNSISSWQISHVMLCFPEIHKSSLCNKIHLRLRNKIHEKCRCYMLCQSIRWRVIISSTKSTYTNKSLHNSANTTNQTSDCRLHVCYQKWEKGKVVLQCINKKWEMADCVFKKGLSCISMSTTLKNRKLHESINKFWLLNNVITLKISKEECKL